MEENTKSGDEGFGFNRKRAEGRDESDRDKKNLQLKVLKLNPVNTIAYAKILGTDMDTQDTSPSVLLFFDKQRFIFNAGEGLQRYCTEHKIKLSKIDHIFLSRVCSETVGGLPGLLLTLAGIGDEGMTVNLWGPSDLKYLLDAMKSFIPNAAMVYARSFGQTPDSNGSPRQISKKFGDPLVLIDDEVIKISAVILRPMEERSHVLSSPQSELNETKPGDLSVIYICELPEIKGKFDPKKASSLGLKPGPKYRELQHGNSVKSDRQNIMVHPSDVLGPSVPGPIVLLVDCPTLAHFEKLSSLQCLTSYYADIAHVSSECPKIVNCVIHLSSAFVTKTPDYQMWMSKFGAAKHIMAGHEMRNIEVPIMKASARIATRRNYLCPQFFPAPGFWSLQHLKSMSSDARASNKNLVSKTSDIIPAENLLKESMGPRWKGKAAEATALADPMSKIVSRLQSSLIESDSHGILSGSSVLLAARPEQTEILNQACFGRPIITTEKDKQWFQLSLEEAFYMCYVMKCIKIIGGNNCTINDTELLQYMASKKDCFPVSFKAYSHLRMKNWVVRAGSQYGVDFVAYRHHPALVHSEYAVLVISEEDGDANGRLRVWSDFNCTLRLCGSVAKTLLVLFISKNGGNRDFSPSCVENYNVEERIISRWIPERSRENQGMEHKKSFKSQT